MKEFREIQKSEWPKSTDNSKVLQAFVNDKFLVQVHQDQVFKRISVNRIKYNLIKGKPVWLDGITWDELQDIKDNIGFKEKWCVECYPPFNKIVNVAPMRHLWVLDEVPVFGWNKQ